MNPYPNKKLENYRRRKESLSDFFNTLAFKISMAIIVLIILYFVYYKFTNKGTQTQVIQPISAFVKALLR